MIYLSLNGLLVFRMSQFIHMAQVAEELLGVGETMLQRNDLCRNGKSR